MRSTLHKIVCKTLLPFDLGSHLLSESSCVYRKVTRVSARPLLSLLNSLMASTLKRTGVSAYRGMVVCKAQATNWSKETMLLRMVEENGASTVFILTDAAKAQFGKCEQWRIYEFKVTGSSVKKSAGIQRFGAGGIYEVIMKFEAKDFKLAEKAFPLPYVYNFKDWEALNQLGADAFIDLLGKVLSKPTLDANSAIPKLLVKCGKDTLVQVVELLGEHANARLNEGDVVAFAGLKIRDWNGQRSLQTALLSLVEVNPVARGGIDFAVDTDDGEPRRKALRMTPQTMMTISQAKRDMDQMLQDATRDANATIASKRFSLVGRLSPLTADFFTNDAPILEKGDANIMCWKSELQDSSGKLEVKVWDKACYEIFGVTADKLRELWETGVENSSEVEKILADLNENLGGNIVCACSADLWRWGGRKEKVAVNVNINDVEIESES